MLNFPGSGQPWEGKDGDRKNVRVSSKTSCKKKGTDGHPLCPK